jgi:hypothetical protein
MLPRPPRKSGRRGLAVAALLVIPPVLIGVHPLVSTLDAAAVPGLLTLTTAAALTALAIRPAGNAVLVATAVVMMISTVGAAGSLDDLARQLDYWQLPELDGVIDCVSTVVTTPAPSLLQATFDFGVAALYLIAPAVLAWSVLQPRSPEDPGA